MAAIPSMFVVDQQVDIRALAGAAVIFTGSLFGAHSSAPQGSQSTFGTHELATKQAAQVSSVWGSARGTAVARANKPFITTNPQLDLTPRQIIWRPARPVANRLFSFVITAPQSDLTPRQALWPPATAAIAVSAQRLLTYTLTAPQFNPTQVQPVIWPPIAGLSTSDGLSTSLTFGTHELAVKQGAQVSRVWPSVRTPPAVAATSVNTWVLAQAQINAAQPQPQVWPSLRTPPAVTGVIPRWIGAQPQPDPTQPKSSVWGPSQNEGGWINQAVLASPQDDPSQVQTNVFKSAAAAVAASASRVLPFIQSAPQADPTQIQSRILPSALTVTYAVETWIQTAPQTDPTQLAPQVYRSIFTPPAIIGPTVTPFVLNGQPDLNLYTVALWTPSTLSPSAPPTTLPPTDQPSGGWEPHHYHPHHSFYYSFEAHSSRSAKRRHEQEERERETQTLSEPDREIARLLHEQEEKEAEKEDLAHLQAMADKFAGTRQQIPRMLSATLLKAQEERSRNALEQLAREMERLFEEEEMSLLLILLNDD